jgi:4-amino-4-deoxy-L-arabinose transferase-like glycosyltransferase
LYILLGRIALALMGDVRLALTTLSALSAALACGLLFLIAGTLFNRRVATYALLLVLCTPVMWLNADKALSDAPGLAAQTACALLTVLALKGKGPLWAAALSLGIAAGFRPQGAIGLAAALLLTVIWLRPEPRHWRLAGLAASIGVLTWLLPLLAAFGWDVGALRTYLAGATGFVTAEESLFATSLTWRAIAARWRELWFWGSQAVFGPLAGWIRVVLFSGTLVLMGVACVRQRRDRGVWLCLAWLGPQALLHLLLLNPSLTRYLLALLLPVAVLVALGLDVLLGVRAALATVLAFVVAVGSATLPLAATLHGAESPPEQLAAYIATRFPPAHTLVVARQSYNALRYKLPTWEVRFADYYGNAALQSEFTQRQPTYIVIADPEALRPDEAYVEVEMRTFARDPQIHAKHAHVDVSVYGRADELSLADFALPESGSIPIGTPQDAKYLLSGWYRREEIGGVAARWTGAEPSATLRVLLPPQATTLTMLAVSYAPGQVVEVLCNDEVVGSADVPQQWTEVTVTLPASCILSDSLTLVSVRPSVLAIPADGGQSTDRRSLGIAVARMRFSR